MPRILPLLVALLLPSLALAGPPTLGILRPVDHVQKHEEAAMRLWVGTVGALGTLGRFQLADLGQVEAAQAAVTGTDAEVALAVGQQLGLDWVVLPHVLLMTLESTNTFIEISGKGEAEQHKATVGLRWDFYQVATGQLVHRPAIEEKQKGTLFEKPPEPEPEPAWRKWVPDSVRDEIDRWAPPKEPEPVEWSKLPPEVLYHGLLITALEKAVSKSGPLFAQTFPIVGSITGIVDGKSVRVDVGSVLGVHGKLAFSVPGPTPEDKPLGVLKVKELGEDSCLLTGSGGLIKKLAVGMQVRSKD